MDIIYTIGGGAILESTFNAIAVIASGDIMLQIARITASLGLFWATITYAIGFDWMKSMKWFAVMATVFSIMIVPKTEVAIQDRLEPGIPRHVENVPLFLGRFAAVISNIGDSLAEVFDQTFSLPEDLKYSTNGFLMGAELMDYLGRITITDLTLKHNVESFMVRCVQDSIELGQYSFKEVLGTNNLFNFLQDNGLSNLRTVTFKEDNPNGSGYVYQLYTCKNAFTNIKNSFDGAEKNKAIKKVGKFLTKITGTDDDARLQAVVTTMLPASADYFINQSQSATDILYHHLLLNAYYEGSANAAGASYETVRAQLQATATYQSIGNIAKEFLPFIRVFFEVVIYALFPVIVILMLLPGAPTVLYNYVQAIIWIQMWAPIYAVIHFFTTFYQHSKLSIIPPEEGYAGYNISTIHDVMAGSGAIGGYMTIFVPFLSWMVLKGFQNMVHMAGSMLQPAIGAASTAAGEATTGNISLGQVGFRNVSHDSYGAFNYDNGINMQNHDLIQGANLDINRYGMDGQAYSLDQSQANSKLRVTPSDTSTVGESYSSASSQSTRYAMDEARNSMESYSAGFNKLFEARSGEDYVNSSGSSYDQRESTAEDKAFNQVERASEELAQRHGITKSTAASLIASLSSGDSAMGKIISKFTGLELGGSSEYRTLSEDAISDAQSIANSKEMQDSLKIVKDSVQSDSFNLRSDLSQSEAESIRSDFNQAESHSVSSSEHLSRSEEFSRRAESSSSNNYAINHDMSNSLVKYVSENFGRNKLSDEKFMKEVAASEEFRDEYHYQQAMSNQPKYDLSKSSREVSGNFYQPNINSQEKIVSTFETFQNNNQFVSGFNNLEENRIDNSGLTSEVSQTINQNSNKIENENIANDQFENDVRDLAKDNSALVKLINPMGNKSKKGVFDEE